MQTTSETALLHSKKTAAALFFFNIFETVTEIITKKTLP
jgi:hypothetical protein